MRRIFSLLFFILIFPPCHAQKTDSKLQQKLDALLKPFHGDAGVYVRNLKTGQTAIINADTLFPTASMIKVPITIAMFDKIEKGEIPYDTIMTYKDSLLYAGDDILGSLKEGEQIALSKVMMLMITTSDNTASLWCQSLAGTGTAINDWLAQNGFEGTRMNSRTPGRQDNWKRYGWGQTTPREMAELMVRIRDGKVVSARASERIYRNLIRIYWDHDALSQIPPYVQVASKQGAVDASRSEVALVNAPHGDYVFCVITKNQQDQTWAHNNEGWVLIRKVSALLWSYFEPDSNWKPAQGLDEWYK
ncbi:MAG: serine hydrolase [Bacteroidia bacterium]|nr:serine hydrolase [Bacteroidia bacterium]